MPAESMLNIARWYDPIFEGILGGLRSMAARVVPPAEGMRVLDIGCGTGAQLAIYQAGGCQVFGIDLSQPMLRVARSKLDHPAVLTSADALRIPYPDRTFDLVISSLFLHQINPGKLTHAFISTIEFFAGWDHFSNSRDFLAHGGIPPLAADCGLQNRKTFVVGNGNLGVYLLHQT